MPGRVFWPPQQRSVRDMYNQLGDVYFRKAYQMKYRTFQTLPQYSVSTYLPHRLERKNTKETIFVMDKYRPMSNLLVPLLVCRRIYIQHNDYLWNRSYGCYQQLLVCCWRHQQSSELQNYVPYRARLATIYSRRFLASFRCQFCMLCRCDWRNPIWVHRPYEWDCIESGCIAVNSFAEERKRLVLIAMQWAMSTAGFWTYQSCSIPDQLHVAWLSKERPCFRSWRVAC